jgi:hypothetical protein
MVLLATPSTLLGPDGEGAGRRTSAHRRRRARIRADECGRDLTQQAIHELLSGAWSGMEHPLGKWFLSTRRC